MQSRRRTVPDTDSAAGCGVAAQRPGPGRRAGGGGVGESGDTPSASSLSLEHARNTFRARARKLLPDLQPEEHDDIASDCLLWWMECGRPNREPAFVVIDHLRSKFGRAGSRRNRERNAMRTDDYAPPSSHRGFAFVDAMDLADHFSRDCPAWVRDAMKMVAMGLTASDASIAHGKTPTNLHQHFSRIRHVRTIEGKRKKRAKDVARNRVFSRIQFLRLSGLRWDEVALTLNEEGFVRPRGQAWTGKAASSLYGRMT